MPEQTASSPRAGVHLPGLDPQATPMVGIGLGLTGLLLGLRPRLAPLSLAATVLAALAYRDPRRITPEQPEALFAPADGLVTAITETYEHRFLHTDAIRLRVEASPLDVPIQRSPVGGAVAYLQHLEGEPVALWGLPGVEAAGREQLLVGIVAECGPILIAITAGAIARRVSGRVTLGQRVEAGTRIAGVRLGAMVDMFVPRDLISGLPSPGEHVRAGLSSMGRVLAL